MKIDIITLFPAMFRGPFDESIIHHAQEKKLVSIKTHNLRTWGIDKRGTVDDHPYGGGPGMLLRPEPIFNAVEELRVKRATQNAKRKNQEPGTRHPKPKTILLDAGGITFNQQKAQELSQEMHLIVICGHYEGVDYRVHEHCADEVISIGDYVLTGGELPAMVLIDAVVRLIPGVLDDKSTKQESFSLDLSGTRNPEPGTRNRLIEYPQYTRPEVFKRHKVPEVLLSGHHAEIEKWREEQALKRTKTA